MGLALLVAFTLVAGGCTSLKQYAASSLQRPTVDLTAVEAEGVDLSGVTLLVRLRVDNPNPVALDLATLRYKLALQDRQVFEGTLPEGVKLAARGPSPLELPVRVRWLDVPGLAQLFMNERSVAAKVSGTAGIRTSFGTLDVPFEETKQVLHGDGP